MRKVVERKYGEKFSRYFRGSAFLTAQAFSRSQYQLRANEPDLPGDIWFWLNGHGTFGHVAIRVGHEQLAQNTERAYDGKDARILLTKAEMDPPDLRVRLR